MIDPAVVFTSEYFGKIWPEGPITWSMANLEDVLEAQLLREAFQLWDGALESVSFQELPPNSGNAMVSVGIGDTGTSNGTWSARWTTVRTDATIMMRPGLDSDLFAATAAHEIGNVLGMGDSDDGRYFQSITSDPLTTFQRSGYNNTYLSRIDYQLIRHLYGEDSSDYVDYLTRINAFSQVRLGKPEAFDDEILAGDDGADLLIGYAGNDTLTGGSGNDLLLAGMGRDRIIGGDGADVMHGDFGANTFGDSRDDAIDKIVVRSDQFIFNPFYGSAGNNPEGFKRDILEGLDPIDKIFIEAGPSYSLDVSPTNDGLGLYVDGFLEALYVGGDLSASQLLGMTQVVA